MGKGGKKSKRKMVSTDIEVGISEIIPSTRVTRQEETESIKKFKEEFLGNLKKHISNSDKFPTAKPVFVYIQQYFLSKREYDSRDVDNLAKTLLDILKGEIYADDSQVKVLLVSKKIDVRITQNFAYIAIKELNSEFDIETLRVSGIDKSVQMFTEIKKDKN